MARGSDIRADLTIDRAAPRQLDNASNVVVRAREVRVERVERETAARAAAGDREVIKRPDLFVTSAAETRDHEPAGRRPPR